MVHRLIKLSNVTVSFIISLNDAGVYWYQW